MGVPFPPDTDFGRTTEELLTVPGFRYVDPSGAQVTTGPLDGIEGIQKGPRDIDAANALLAEAGHPNGFEVTPSARNAVGYSDEAAIVAEQLKKIGINATIKTYQSAAGYRPTTSASSSSWCKAPIIERKSATFIAHTGGGRGCICYP